jgi:N-acetyl-beta-hexosaminidase
MEVRKAKIQAQMQENNYESKKSANDVKLNNVLMKLQMYTALYQAYNTSWTEQSNLLSEAAELELETGGIDYYRYVLARSKVLEIRTKRLELINQLNQTYFELEYYISPVNQ